MAKLLIADDHSPMRRAVRRFLEARGHDVLQSASIPELREALATQEFDAVLLDRNFPDGDALDVCRDMRAQQDDTPVLIVSALKSVPDIVEGLHAGADDYVVKPLHLTLLEARLMAVLRRSQETRITVGPFVVSRTSPWVIVDGTRKVSLGEREAVLLRMLAERAGQVASRAEIFARLWTDPVAISDNALDAVVSRLRRRLGARHDHLETVRGQGFRLRA